MKVSARLLVGLLISLLFFIPAILAPLLPLADPQAILFEQRLLPPSWEHPFGTDANGSSVLSRCVWGARISLLVAVVSVSIAVTIGLLVGSVAGYRGKLWDHLIMRIIDMIYAFPGFLLALALVAVLGPSLWNLVFALSLTGWAGYARLIRGEVLRLKEREHVLAARALGASDLRIVTRHIWPSLLGPLLVQASVGLAGTILSEGALSFLGLGVPAQIPTWGSMLSVGRTYLFEAPHVALAPGMCIALLVLAFNLLGDARE